MKGRVGRCALVVAASALAALAALLVAGQAATADNTPPGVVIETPLPSASLARTVQVTGTATDAEGFNVSSQVEMRWDDWEWFTVPSNIAGQGTLYFGETVDLTWHAPGEHVIHVRAFDGELYGEEASVTVSLRDLADLVVLPRDIALSPAEPREGEEVQVAVSVRNDGGEEVQEATVWLSVDGERVATSAVGPVPARGSADVTLWAVLVEGNVTLEVGVEAAGAAVERTTDNNAATLEARVAPGEEAADQLLVALGIAVVAALLLAAMVLARGRGQ